jgi:hypothetical protein
MPEKAGIIVDDYMYLLVGGTKFTHVTSVNMTMGAEMIDVTSYDSSKRKQIQPGDTNWSMSVEAHYAMDAAEGGNEAMAAILAGTIQTVLLSSAVTDDTTFTGSAYIDSVTFGSSKGSSTTVSINYSGTSTLTIGVVA